MRNTFGCLLARRATLAALAATLAAAGLGVAGSPTLAKAQSDAAVTYVDEAGAAHELAAGSYTDISDKSFGDKVGYGLTDGWYVVRSSRDFEHRLTVTGDAKLVLCDGATANFTDGIRGYSGRLTIYGQSEQSGLINASARNSYAAIGGNDGEDNGTEIIVCSGSVVAIGNDFGAGIGGGNHGGCGIVRILGGHVHSESGEFPLYNSSLRPDAAAAIGSGNAARHGGTIEIAGGTVEAAGCEYGAGIGSGDESERGVDVTITGGDVTAESMGQSAAIGSGNEACCCKVSIAGGRVTASVKGNYGAAIGGGDQTTCDVEISGGTVSATGDSFGAGIGTGDSAKPGTIVITGGTVSATGGQEAAAIGGGDEGDSGNIAITGGTVEARSNEGASTVGCGDGGENKGKITLADDLAVYGDQAANVASRDERLDALMSWRHLRVAPCEHNITRLEQTEKTHRLACAHCLARIHEEPHEFGKDGACATCGYHADGPTIGAELGMVDKMTGTLRFWVAPGCISGEALAAAYVDVRVDGAYEVDGSSERCKRVDLAGAEVGEHGEVYAECRVVTGTEEDAPVTFTLHYGGDQTMVYETTLSELRKS